MARDQSRGPEDGSTSNDEGDSVPRIDNVRATRGGRDRGSRDAGDAALRLVQRENGRQASGARAIDAKAQTKSASRHDARRRDATRRGNTREGSGEYEQGIAWPVCSGSTRTEQRGLGAVPKGACGAMLPREGLGGLVGRPNWVHRVPMEES